MPYCRANQSCSQHPEIRCILSCRYQIMVETGSLKETCKIWVVVATQGNVHVSKY